MLMLLGCFAQFVSPSPSTSVAYPGPRLFVVPGVLGFPTMASTVLPAKGMCFSFSVPADTAVDEIMDAFQVTAGSGGLKFLQHQGGTRFMSSVTSISAANRLVAQGNLVLRDVAVPLEAVGVHVLHVFIFVPRRTRVVKVEMTKQIHNFVTTQGRRVMLDCRGLRRVCSRCEQEGHIGPACKTARCERCAVFGHPTAGCTAPCFRCGHAHATADCKQRRSYAAVAHPAGAPRPNQPSQGAAGKSPSVPEELNDNLDPSIRPRDLPLAPSDTPSDDAAASPGALDSQESDVADSSHSPGRLVISDDTDLTPGQREPSTRSELSPSTQPAGKMLRRRTTDALNEVVNRIRALQRGGARTHLMSEYLAVLRDRHQRLLRLSS
ncbi:hypothetical protein HPB47_001049 [Ixodes persulcatus]|uniref:Uncharacterized protein n=1 Tax=Ixodes persulcatus TaxID=34615 RepID=A0AC60PRK4_IXOPE|nr:hypothetical protein HPB47_001049 [Ixodes persulcatus]